MRLGEFWNEDDAPAITTLTGAVADQAALLGLLQKLYPYTRKREKWRKQLCLRKSH